MKIQMPYLREVSVNSYRIVGKGGRPTNAIKPSVLFWMADLADRIREHPDFDEYYGIPCIVYVKGFFVDGRVPDIHNLFKCVADAIEPAIGVNDRDIRCIDRGYDTGVVKPYLEIELEPI